MADPPNIAGDMSSEGAQQVHADPPADENLAMFRDQIEYSWNRTAENCIPLTYRPAGPLSKAIIMRLSGLACIAPNEKGLFASKRLIKSAIMDRQRASSNNGTSEIQAEDVENVLHKMVKLLTAVRDINIAGCIDGSFLHGHNLKSNDPYDWGFYTVVAFGDLAKLTKMSSTRVTQAGDLWRTHFATRLKERPQSPKNVIAADIQLAIDDFKSGLDEDQTTGVDDGVSGLPSPTHDEKQQVSTQNGHFCTTGAIFQPALPTLGILLSIGKMYYNARNQPAPGFKNIPIIMTREMASKGMFYDNAGAENVGTFLKQDGRNYSYKNFYTNMTAILELEKRFGKPFWEIFESPDIQAQQAVRMAKNVLPTLAGITSIHRINQVATLKDVCNEYFDRYPDLEKTRTLTTENVRQISHQLAIAAPPNADGVKYKGWPSLGGNAAGPVTPPATQVARQQTRRRIRESSPTSASEEPATKKPKPSLTVAARAAYVASHVPDRDAILDYVPSRRSTAGQAITPVSRPRLPVMHGQMREVPVSRSRLIVTNGQMREVPASRLRDISTTLAPPTASSTPISRQSTDGEAEQRITELEDEGVQPDIGPEEVQATLGPSLLQNNSLSIRRDAPGEYLAKSSEMVIEKDHENLETGMKLYAETAPDFEVSTKLGEEFQQKGIATAEGLHSQMQVQANQAENTRGSTQTEVQELKQQLQQARDKIKETDIKAETAEERAKKAEKRAMEAEQKLEQKVKDLQELAEGSRRLWTQLLEIASD